MPTPPTTPTAYAVTYNDIIDGWVYELETFAWPGTIGTPTVYKGPRMQGVDTDGPIIFVSLSKQDPEGQTLPGGTVEHAKVLMIQSGVVNDESSDDAATANENVRLTLLQAITSIVASSAGRILGGVVEWKMEVNPLFFNLLSEKRTWRGGVHTLTGLDYRAKGA